MRPEKTGRLSLLIFDWDGTLMDSVASIVGCMQATTEKLGLDPIPEDRIRNTIGLGIRDTMEILCPGLDEGEHQEVLLCYRRLWLETFSLRGVPFPGVAETLETLRRQGYLLAVATGKSRKGLDRELADSGLKVLFDATCTVDEAPSKPDPAMLLQILDELGRERHESLMIGDTTFDLEMARHAGVGAVAVASGSHRREWLEEAEPMACLASVVEVPAWLEGLAG